MNWSVIRETGRANVLPPTANGQRICFPTFAMRGDEGIYLIGDELGVEKRVPFRLECRTMQVDAGCKVVYDSLSAGIDDGFGCLLSGGRMALLRRTKWELQIIAADGALIDRFSLAACSKRLPRFVTATCQGTLVVVFFNRSGEIDVVEIDDRGRPLWYLPPGVGSIGIVGSVQLTTEDTFLIADPFRHVVVELDRNGNVVWQFGVVGDPGLSVGRLSSPTSARRLSDGRCLIADTRNHRILTIDQNGSSSLDLPTGSLSDPTYADVLENENYLICDTGNARVIELDRAGQIVWQYGDTLAPQRLFSYPRSVEATAPDSCIVADTGHDRIVEVVAGRVVERLLSCEPPLFWPRCVRMLSSGELLVTDARNARIMTFSADGQILKQLTHINLRGRRALQDPHDVRMLANGHLLITDSPQDLVVETDWSGVVYREVGHEANVQLSDPHSAQQIEDGSLLISDTGNDRVLLVDGQNCAVKEIDKIWNDFRCLRLNQPRYAELSQDGLLIIADTGNNRVFAATESAQLVWEFSRVPNSRLPYLNQPRWASSPNPNEVLICDHFHHRILHVKRDLSEPEAM